MAWGRPQTMKRPLSEAAWGLKNGGVIQRGPGQADFAKTVLWMVKQVGRRGTVEPWRR